MKHSSVLVLVGIILFCCMPISLLFPGEIEVEYQEQEYKLVEHEDILLNENWPEENGFFIITKSYPLDLEENWDIAIHIKNDLALFAEYRFTIREDRWGEVVYETEPNQGASITKYWTVPKNVTYYFTVEPLPDPDLPHARGSLRIGKCFSKWEWVDVTKTKLEFNPNIIIYNVVLAVLGTIFIIIGLRLR